MSCTVYIGGFTYELGENEYTITDLDVVKDSPDLAFMLENSGFQKYRTSDLTVLDLAGKSIGKMFEKVSISAREIDAVIIATNSLGVSDHLSPGIISEFLLQHNLENAYPLITSLSFSGNFLVALKQAYEYLQTDDFRHILVVTCDVFPQGHTRIDIHRSILSDASACCLLSKIHFSDLKIESIKYTANASIGVLDPVKDFPKYVTAVSDGIKKVTASTITHSNIDKANLKQVFTNNYSRNTCKSYLRLIGIPDLKINLDNIGRFGHAATSDVCINFCDFNVSNIPKPDEHFLFLSSGPFTWGSAIISSINNK